MWRQAVWLIIIALMAGGLLTWCIWYWRKRKDVEDDQAFEREVMEHEKRMEERDEQ